jgi:hypothetical protein
MDEAFETLTLVQTGKASMIPIVLVEGAGKDGRGYWDGFIRFVRESCWPAGWISPEDVNLYYIARDPEDAVEHVLKFYRNYHSSRYVRDDLVIRLKQPPDRRRDSRPQRRVRGLVKTGSITQRGPYDEESDHLELRAGPAAAPGSRSPTRAGSSPVVRR